MEKKYQHIRRSKFNCRPPALIERIHALRQSIGSSAGITHRHPPTPPDARFSASGDWNLRSSSVSGTQPGDQETSGFVVARTLARDILPHCPFVFLRDNVCLPPFRAAPLAGTTWQFDYGWRHQPGSGTFHPDRTPAGHTSAAFMPRRPGPRETIPGIRPRNRRMDVSAV